MPSKVPDDKGKNAAEVVDKLVKSIEEGPKHIPKDVFPFELGRRSDFV